MKTQDRTKTWWLALVVLAASLVAGVAEGQLDETCTVAVLNRTARVNTDGSWSIPNVPTNAGQVRARATCVKDGVTRNGVSGYFTVPRNGVVLASPIVFEAAPPVPASMRLTAPDTALDAGDTVQLTVTVTNPDGSQQDMTAASTGTTYTTSSPAVVAISPDGLVTATGNGVVLVSALNEGAFGLVRITVGGPSDADGDGMTDDYERQFGFDPNDPADAALDADADGLTNLQEFLRGTAPRTVDTDGDGISDGLEVQTSSDPLNPGSYNLNGALRSIAVAPVTVELRGNPLFGDISRQLTVTGNLLDGRTIDLTSRSRGTTYTSSDLLVVNFSTTSGLLFAGQAGTASVTVAVGGFTTIVPVSVTAFTPRGISSIDLPGYANNVKVLNGFAYVAAGAAGLQIVNVSDRTAPQIAASYPTNGRAYDLRIVGKYVYIADGFAGLDIIDVGDPFDPYSIGTVDTPGTAQDIWIDGNYAYIADGATGLQIIDITDPQRPLRLSNVPITGTAKGVSVSNGYAVVATGDGRNGLVVIDVRDPLHPVIAGSVIISGEPKDVVARGTLAYVASYSSGAHIVDFSTPAAPRVVGATGMVIAPRDVVLLGNTAVFGEQLFPHAVPFFDANDPQNPVFRGIIDLSPLGDYAETGIDIDSAYVYTTGEYFFVGRDYADAGRTALFIAQYAPVDDPASAFPTVTITSPADGEDVVGGTMLPITVNATDDERVASVAFYADGVQVATTQTPPFTVEVLVPEDVTSLTLNAVAFDFAGRAGQSADVVVGVIPDPGTTITGIVRGPGGVPQPGVRVELVDRDDTTLTGNDGRYTFTGKSTIDGAYEIYADAEIGPDAYDGRIKAVLPVRGGVTEVPDLQLDKVTPLVEIFAPPYGGTLIGGTTATVLINASSRLYGIASISLAVDGATVGTQQGSSASISFPVPNVAGTLRIVATAIDDRGHRGSSEEVLVEVVADPLTTVRGTVVDASGTPVASARVSVLDGTATTGSDGKYVIEGVSTVAGDLVAGASAFVGGTELVGVSDEWPPVPGGITWLDVTVRGFPVGKIAEVSIGGYGNAADVQGSRLYVAGGLTPGLNNLQIVDVSNPAAPQILGGTNFMTLVTDVKVVGSTAYVSAGSLHIVDVSNPAALRIVGSLPTVATHKLQVAGHVVFAIGPDGLTSIDVSNPAAPRVLAKLGSFKLAPRAIALTGTRAVVVEHTLTLTTGIANTDVHILDLNNPNAPARLGRVTISTAGRIHDVAVRGTRAYLAMTSGNSGNSGIPMIDFSNPAAPVLSGTYTQTNLLPYAIAAHGDLLVVAGGSSSASVQSQRLQVLNAAVNPPQQVTGLDTGGGASTAVALSGSFAYALSGGSSTVEYGACCVDNVVTARYRGTSDSSNVRPSISFTRPQSGDVLVDGSLVPIQVAVTDDVAVNSVTINVNGRKLLTTTNASPRVLYRIPDGQTSLSIAVTATDFGGNTGESTLTFQVGADPRTTVTGVVRASDGTPVPATVTVGALSTTTDPSGGFSLANVPTSENVIVNVRGTLNGETLRVTSSPLTPVSGGVTNVPTLVAVPRPTGPLSSIATPGPARAAAVRGNVAFVVNGSSTNFRSYLQAIDISDVEAPRVIGQLFMFEVPFGIAVSGNYAYVATANNGIVIVDVSDPANLRRVRFFGFGNGTDDVAVVGNTLYSGTRNGTVFVIDVSDPSNPVVLSSVRTSDTANTIAVSGRYALTAGGRGNSNEGGFNVIDVTDPRKATFLSDLPPLVPTLGYAIFGNSVAARGSMAYVATPGTSGGSVLAIDFSNPAAPQVVRTFTGMIPLRVDVSGKTLVTAGRTITFDGSQGNGILGVFDLDASTFTATFVNMTNAASYFPSGLTVSGDVAVIPSSILGSHDYRTFFAKVPATVDRAGTPPVITINSPVAGDRVTEGDHVPVTVSASDDVGVASVEVTANGVGAGYFTAAPYTTVLSVPAGVSTLTLRATATDLSGNTGQASDVIVDVRPDPGTTVNGRVVNSGGTSVANATVTLRGQKATTDATGAYTFASVATVPGTLIAEAVGRVSGNVLGIGTSVPTTANAGAFTTIPDIVLQVPPVGPIKSFPLSNPANAVAMNGSLAVVAQGCCGLLVLDVTNPYKLAVLSTVSLRSNTIAADVKLSGNYAYVAGGSFAGMSIVDLSTPTAPVTRGFVTGGNPQRLAVSGTTLYVADSSASGGLRVIDATDPALPAVVGSLVMNRWIADVEVSGSHVVLLHAANFDGNQDPRLSIVDVSNPASPLLLGSIAVPGTAAKAVVLRGTTAFVVGGREVQMFDFSNPAVPTLLGRFSQTSVTAFAAADAGAHLLQVGTISAPHTVEIINASTVPGLSLGGLLQYPNVNGFAGVSVAVADDFVLSAGQSGWPLQFGSARVYLAKWR